jgi:hypothetical protein
MTDNSRQPAKFDYPLIRLWHETTGSMPYYIEDLVARARADDAPPTAIYQGQDKVWRTIDQVTNLETIHRLLPYVSARAPEHEALLRRIRDGLEAKHEGVSCKEEPHA